MEERAKQERHAIQNLELDAQLWKALVGLLPEDVCQRSLISYDPRLPCYHIQVLNEYYHVFPEKWLSTYPINR